MEPLDSGPLYRDSRIYDLLSQELAPNDIPFYLRQIKEFGEPVLELACGTGRISIPLAEEGVKISGLDISKSMLCRAKEKAAQKGVTIDWILADCRDFKVEKKFRVIFFPYNSMLHLLDRESLESCFSSVKRHLEEGGRFIVDVFNPDLSLLTRDPSERYPTCEYFDPEAKAGVEVTENNLYDAATQVNQIKFYFRIEGREEETVIEFSLRVIFPRELEALLHYNGFFVEARYGNYNQSPFAWDSPKQIMVCRAQR